MRGTACLALFVQVAAAQVTYDRLLNAGKEPHNWLTYHGSYASQHHTTLNEITRENVGRLKLNWVWQGRSLEKFEPTSLVVDGVMYFTEPPNNVYAVDARTGRVFWSYRHVLPDVTYACCGKVNRGLAILDHTLYMTTIDAKLVALDARTGKRKWEKVIAEYKQGYSMTVAPLIVKDKVIIGPAGGELGIRGFLAAYDAKTGEQAWRFNTVPQPGEPGNETWGLESWKYGGGSVWLTGSYDPELNLVFWGIGNPGPDWNAAARPGDNLYSSSVIALDADTGKRKWHFQFTPNDAWDWDAVQTPVLTEVDVRGEKRKVILWANRNGFFYVLDRATGQFLHGKAFAKQTWAKGLDDSGRPIRNPDQVPSPQGTVIWPGVQGATNWYAPSYSPVTGLFYVTAWEDYWSTYYTYPQQYEQGKWYAGGSVKAPVPATNREEVNNKRSKSAGYGAVRALDPKTGNKVWDFAMSDVSDSGLLTTATNVLFSGNREGHFFALDAATGKLLWRRYLGGQVLSSPISYAIDGRQYITITSGAAMFTFSLHDPE